MIRRSSVPEIKSIENKLLDSIEYYDSRRHYMQGITNTVWRKYGNPVIYMGNLNPSEQFDWEAIVLQSRKLPTSERIAFLNENLRRIPRIPLSAFYVYPELDIVYIGERQFCFSQIISYSYSSTGPYSTGSFLIQYRSKNNGPRIYTDHVYISSDQERYEAKEILEFIVHGVEPKTAKKISSIESGYEDFDGHPSFFGISLSHKKEEMVSLLRQMGFEFNMITKDRFIFKGQIQGVQFDFHMYADHKTGIVWQIWGISEKFIGYDVLREKYDAIVDMMRSIHGPLGMKKKDLPKGIRKNSIMKCLRESSAEVEVSYSWMPAGEKKHSIPTEISLCIGADEDCLKEGFLCYNLQDGMNIDRIKEA